MSHQPGSSGIASGPAGLDESTLARVGRALRVWYAVVGGIGAWTVHLVAEASLVRYACTAPGVEWVLHAVTALTALATLLALWLAAGLVRESRAAESAGTPAGRTRFLGHLGLLIGAINLVLILLEGSYVLFLKSCA